MFHLEAEIAKSYYIKNQLPLNRFEHTIITLSRLNKQKRNISQYIRYRGLKQTEHSHTFIMSTIENHEYKYTTTSQVTVNKLLAMPKPHQIHQFTYPLNHLSS
jgi:hypothetical protein